MKHVLRGRVAWRFGDFFQCYRVLGNKGMADSNRDPENLKKYVLTAYDPEFPQKFRKGDLMIAGKAFGGSRDRQSLSAMQALGVSAIIAESFSRVILRSAILYAFPVVECNGITEFANLGDELEVDIDAAVVRNLTASGKELECSPLLGPQKKILEAGGMIPYLKRKLGIQTK